MFQCDNKKCIPTWWKCDKVNDCGDDSDEKGCGFITTTVPPKPVTAKSPPRVCKHNEFQCLSGTCIPESWLCDGSNDCDEKEDEAKCGNVQTHCGVDYFHCRVDGSCIHISQVCDGSANCPDGSDEANCKPEHTDHQTEPPTLTCTIGFFPCDGFRCLPSTKYCDGERDCEDNADELDCSKGTKIYQILQMGVDERSINSTSLLLYWWIPVPQKVKFQYLPSISKANVGNAPWKNHTSWIEETDFRFTNLAPYTEYNLTVYVRVAGNGQAFPPAKYFNATTGEGGK